MTEYKAKLKGWQAIVGVVIVIAFVGVRLMTFSDKKDDKTLMKQIDVQLMCEYSPHVAEKLRAAHDTGDEGKIQEAVTSVTSTKVNIESVKASYPLFDFSIPKDVVIKVEFSLDDASGAGDTRTIYYLFRHGAFGWQFRYVTSVVNYYLNFM